MAVGGSMKLTIDTSVAVKLVIEEPGSNAAQLLVESEAVLIAPELIHVEMTNALWANTLHRRITPDLAQDLAVQWPVLFDEFHANATLAAEALRLALA